LAVALAQKSGQERQQQPWTNIRKLLISIQTSSDKNNKITKKSVKMEYSSFIVVNPPANQNNSAATAASGSIPISNPVSR
jgi:hypothetical protein